MKAPPLRSPAAEMRLQPQLLTNFAPRIPLRLPSSGLLYSNLSPAEVSSDCARYIQPIYIHQPNNPKTNQPKRQRKSPIERKPRQAYSARQLKRLEEEFKVR